MDVSAWLIAALVLVPACAAVAWVLFCMAQTEDDLRAFTDRDALPASHAVMSNARTERQRWPTPG